MDNWRKASVGIDSTIRETLETIDRGATNIALVVDSNDRLLGVVTDGDIRRGLLKGVTLDDPVSKVYSSNPIVASFSADHASINRIMEQHDLHQIPVLDSHGKVVGLKCIDDLLHVQKIDNLVVLMAGGQGARLRPMTEDCPKPLLRIGGKPILQTIIENFLQYGFHRFVVSLNYKASMIKDYFRDGNDFGVSIQYIEEHKPLGTAGAIGMLKEKIDEPIIVMNGDLMTKVNFRSMLTFHEESHAFATMGIREHNIQVPYGVVFTEGESIVRIEEKPVRSFFVNSGIYVLSPEGLDYITPNEFLDMPTLFEKIICNGKRVCSFPIMEYWLDIGHKHDFERAVSEYPVVFEKNFE